MTSFLTSPFESFAGGKLKVLRVLRVLHPRPAIRLWLALEERRDMGYELLGKLVGNVHAAVVDRLEAGVRHQPHRGLAFGPQEVSLAGHEQGWLSDLRQQHRQIEPGDE